MRCLIDTHALIWWWLDDMRLSPTIRAMMIDPAHDVHVSSVCGWEIANKVRIGKLPQMAEQVHRYDALVADDGMIHLAIRHDHALRAGLLPGAHRDPFDRMIAAQALIEGLTVISRDPAFAAFGCDAIW